MGIYARIGIDVGSRIWKCLRKPDAIVLPILIGARPLNVGGEKKDRGIVDSYLARSPMLNYANSLCHLALVVAERTDDGISFKINNSLYTYSSSDIIRRVKRNIVRNSGWTDGRKIRFVEERWQDVSQQLYASNTCGLHMILNIWAHVLSMEVNPRWEPTEALYEDAVRLVRLLRSYVGTLARKRLRAECLKRSSPIYNLDNLAKRPATKRCVSRVLAPPKWTLGLLPEHAKTRQLQRLVRLPVVRDLEFRPNVVLPDPWTHSTSVGSAILFRRGAVASEPCTNCARGNGRFPLCVHIEPDKKAVFPKEPYHGTCANCLSNGAKYCSISESSVTTSSSLATNTQQDFLTECRLDKSSWRATSQVLSDVYQAHNRNKNVAKQRPPWHFKVGMWWPQWFPV